jgi:hypothetical protein
MEINIKVAGIMNFTMELENIHGLMEEDIMEIGY